MKRLFWAVLLISEALLSGCSHMREERPVFSTQFSYYAAPGRVSTASTAEKRGEACAASYLSLVAVGDASIDTAKKLAGITKVASVDHTFTQVYVYYSQYCTIVRGE